MEGEGNMKKEGCDGCERCESCGEKVAGEDGKIPNPDVARFLSMAGVVAAKYGMTVDIDMEKKLIDFQGDVSKEVEFACGREIAELFGKYSID